MDEPIKLALFRAYRTSYAKMVGAAANDDTILCPICVQPVTEVEVRDRDFSVEHIVPQLVTRKGANRGVVGTMGDSGSRSGLTITCTTCNRRKGRQLDRHFSRAFSEGSVVGDDSTLRTAVLTYAYLCAFAYFGYRYILHESLDEIRAQIEKPKASLTRWLSHVHLSIDSWTQPIVLNTDGYPCFFTFSRELTVSFWRASALLPLTADGITEPVEIPLEIVRKAGVVPDEH